MCQTKEAYCLALSPPNRGVETSVTRHRGRRTGLLGAGEQVFPSLFPFRPSFFLNVAHPANRVFTVAAPFMLRLSPVKTNTFTTRKESTGRSRKGAPGTRSTSSHLWWLGFLCVKNLVRALPFHSKSVPIPISIRGSTACRPYLFLARLKARRLLSGHSSAPFVGENASLRGSHLRPVSSQLCCLCFRVKNLVPALPFRSKSVPIPDSIRGSRACRPYLFWPA